MDLKQARQFYKSSVWRDKRQAILERDNFECQRCKQEGKVTQANTVHHIAHLRDSPKLALVDSNLVSLCAACHNDVHPEKQRDLQKRNRAAAQEIHDERWE